MHFTFALTSFWSNRSVRLALSYVMTAFLAAVIFLSSPYFLVTFASLTEIWILAIISFALPRLSGKLFFVLGFCAALVTRSVMEVKIALTEVPLTLFDIRIAASDPHGFLDAMQWPYWTLPAAWLVVICMVAGLAAALAIDVMRCGRSAVLAIGHAAVLSFAVVSLAQPLAKALHVASQAYVPFVESAWMPDAQSMKAEQLGSLAFILYSKMEEDSAPNVLLERKAQKGAVSGPVALPDYVRLAARDNTSLAPDIVVVLLESAFDVGKMFDIVEPLSTRLQAGDELSFLSGPLMVNITGGGTWITEFETITGLDNRLFGFMGYYTHVAVAPFIKTSLVTHLEKRGYASTALYPVEGDFYGARNAYTFYGFDSFFEATELGLVNEHYESNPWGNNDEFILGKYAGKIAGLDGSKPQFVYALTIANHSPHPCTHFKPETISHHIKGPAKYTENCALNEILLRGAATERGLATLERTLAERQDRTGRPWVMMIFGDHQPHTIIGTYTGQADFAPHRKRGHYETFYQFRGTQVSPFSVKQLPAHVTSLPSLLSAVAASNPEDIYMPENLAVLQECGPDVPIPKWIRKKDSEKQTACHLAIDAMADSINIVGRSPELNNAVLP